MITIETNDATLFCVVSIQIKSDAFYGLMESMPDRRGRFGVTVGVHVLRYNGSGSCHDDRDNGKERVKPECDRECNGYSKGNKRRDEVQVMTDRASGVCK